MARKYTQGFFKLKNPGKYKGNPTEVIYRSSWELKVMINLDNDPSVIQWSSEETVIPYRCKTDNSIHRYFVDFTVKRIYPDGTTKTFLLEIKPFKETIPPEVKKSKSKKYINEVMTYAKNTSKWEAAKEYCKKRGYEFQLITEHQLGIK